MKSITLLFILLLPFTSRSQTWTQKANFGGSARRSAVAIAIGDKGYTGTGYNGNFYKDWWEYDPAADTWTQKADFIGTERFSAVGFTVNNIGYVGTGYDVNNNFNTSDFYSYDPSANSWVPIASLPPAAARRYAVGLAVSTKGYVGTGVNDYGYLKDFWQYDPDTDTWTQKTDFPGDARYECISFTIKGRGYIGIGAYSGTLYHDFYEYNPETDMWTQKSDYPGSGQDAAFSFAIKDTGYIGGGSDQQNSFSDFWGWDEFSDTWIQKADFGGAPRAFGVGVTIGAKGYAGLGEQANYYNDWWEYCPDTSAIPTGNSPVYQKDFFVSEIPGQSILIHHLFSSATFSIYDLNGRKIFSTALNESNHELLISAKIFGEGIFLYEAREETGISEAGKLLLQ
ncbi:MAG: kelch repeat-containing protein [Chitinophagales bacterium]